MKLNENLIIPYKLLHISFLGNCHFFLGLFIGSLFEKLMIKFNDDYKKKMLFFKILDLILSASLIIISSYIVRNIIQFIPFYQFENYDFKRVKEINSNIFTAFSILIVNKSFYNKANHLISNLNLNVELI